MSNGKMDLETDCLRIFIKAGNIPIPEFLTLSRKRFCRGKAPNIAYLRVCVCACVRVGEDICMCACIRAVV